MSVDCDVQAEDLAESTGKLLINGIWISGAGRSMIVAAAKSSSAKMPALQGQVPVFLNPVKIFLGTNAQSRASFTKQELRRL